MSGASADDEALAKLVAVQARIRDFSILSRGSTFLTARANHVSTRRDVLLTIARPNDADARTQLRVVREMLDAVHDERIGVVIDLFWDESDRETGWLCLMSPLHIGLRPLNEALLGGKGLGHRGIIRSLRDVCKQVAEIHQTGHAHGDISLQNVGVDASGRVHIIDFEHVVGISNLGRRKMGLSPAYAHPDKLAEALTGATDVARHQVWDRYALGKLFLNVLSYLSPHSDPELTPRVQRAVRLIGCLLLDGRNIQTELALGLAEDFFSNEKFVELDQAIDALDRILGRARIEDHVPEIASSTTTVVEVGSVAPAPLTERVRDLLRTAPMRYLGEFNQLGLICFVWPTASHRRLEHAIGTYGLTTLMVRSLLADPENPLFQVVMTAQRVRVLILAALLHDVGHYPLAHDLEEAHHRAFEHEDRSQAFILSGEISSLLSAPEKDAGWNVNPADVASVIHGTPLDGATLSLQVCELLHSVISGPLDADKLDYLRRDSERLNVRAGEGIDVARILAAVTITTIVSSHGPTLCLAVRAKSRRPAELVGRIRSHMFGVAYWHHSYRAIKSMIHWMVWVSLEQQGTRPVRAGQRLASALYRYIDESLVDSDQVANSPLLFSLRDANLSARSGLPPAEAEILKWLAARGGDDSESMLLLLADHRWFRSVLTVEHPDSLAGGYDQKVQVSLRAVWSLLAKIYALDDDRRWLVRLRATREFQRRILQYLQPQTEGEGQTIVYDFANWKSNLIAEGSTKTLFLIDGPDESRAFQKPLYYTTGERRSGKIVNVSAALPTVHSYDDRQLSSEFIRANGAVRIFCHPKFDAFVESALTQETLTSLLVTALEAALR